MLREADHTEQSLFKLNDVVGFTADLVHRESLDEHLLKQTFFEGFGDL